MAGPAASRMGITFVVLALLIAATILVLDIAFGADVMLTGTLVAAPLLAALRASPRQVALVWGVALAFGLLTGALNGGFGSLDHATRMLPVALGGALAVFAAQQRLRRDQDAVRLQTQYAVARVFSESTSLEEAAPELVRAIAERHNWELGAFWTVDANDRARFVGSWSASDIDAAGFDDACRNLVPHTGLPARVVDSGAPVWVPDVMQDPGFRRQAVGERAGLRGFVGFPIRTAGGIVAIMEFFARDVREPDPDLLALFEALGAQIGEFVESIRADQTARESDALRSAVVESSLDCIVLMDHEGRVVGFNPAAERTFGYSEAEVLGGEMAELIVPPALRDAHRNALRRYVETGEATILGERLELTGMRKDGSEFPVELSIMRIADTDPPTFTGHLRDISERQRAEAEREAAREQLEAILGGVADGVTAQAPDGSLLFANEAAVRVLGFDTPAELLEAPLTEIMSRFEVYDEHGQRFPLDRLPGRRALAGESGASELLRFRVVATGEERWSVVKATPLLDDAGRVEMAINVFEDITDHKLAERQQAFLVESTGVLAGSLDFDETLKRVAWLAVPDIADWCAVDLAADGAGLQRVALVHADPDMLALAEEFRRRYPPDPHAKTGVPKVLRTCEPELWPEISDEMLEAIVDDPEQLELLRRIGLRSALIVPMVSQEEAIGALTFATGPSGRLFSEQDLAMAQELARRCALAIESSRAFSERDYIARTLQNSLLPAELPQIPGIETAARFRATGEGNEVGGDFYDLFPTGGHGWSVVVGDVCGKGPDAAAVTALARYTVRAAAMRERLPSRVLAQLNEALLRQPGERRFCTVAYAYLEALDDGARLGLASGGHPLPLLLRHNGGGVEWLGEHGMLLGAVPDPALEDRSVTLGAGDAIVFYTDGVTEAGSPRNALGEARLAEVVAGCSGLDADSIAGAVEAAALEADDGTPRDDIAVVVVRVADGDHQNGANGA